MFTKPFCGYMNRISGVIVSVLACSPVDRGFEPRSGQTKDFAIGICSFPLSTQHLGERAKSGRLGFRIMCPSGMTCLPADFCFSELAL